MKHVGKLDTSHSIKHSMGTNYVQMHFVVPLSFPFPVLILISFLNFITLEYNGP